MSTSILAQEKIASALAVTKAGTSYTDSVDFSRCQGDASLLVASTAGSVTITQQCSADNVTFYDPLSSTGTAYGEIASDMTVTTGAWISFTPCMSPYIRFKIVEGNVAATEATIKLFFREEA